MADQANDSLIVEFENILITSFSRRGLGSESIKELTNRGIERVSDLKGKDATKLRRRGCEYLLKSLGEILCVIGIEYGIESSYFLNYPFMSQYEKSLSEMRSNPLSIPLERLPMDINIGRRLRNAGLVTIGDIIGKKHGDVRLSGIGIVRLTNLENALMIHNVVIKDEKFVMEPKTTSKGKNPDVVEPKEGTDPSITREEQLKTLFKLAAEVAALGGSVVENANIALRGIIEAGNRGRI